MLFRSEIPLLWFRNGSKALSIQSTGNGNLAVFGFPLSDLNEAFARHILFVPTLYSLVINSLPHQMLAYTIGIDAHATLPNVPSRDLTSWSVLFPDKQQSFIPLITTSEENTMRMQLSALFDKAGHYRVMSGDTIAAAVSMNYDRRESDFRFYSYSQLREEVEKYNLKFTSVVQNQDGRFSEAFNEITSGKRIWKWFIILALLFIAAEAAIARFWK